MVSKASIMRHPIHPMLVPLPIGLWIFSLFCDLMFLGHRDEIWATLALYTMVGGIVGALLAAMPGLIDLLSLPPSHAKKKGVYHMSLNLALVVLYLVNYLWRKDAMPTDGPLMLSMFAVLLLAASGWLGGEMVYVHGVAVEPVDKELLGENK
jgi:uncharacterized membrane protein